MGSMQAIIIALHDCRYLRQLTDSFTVGQLPISKEHTILSNLIKNFTEVGVTKPIIVCRPHQSEAIKRCLPPDSKCDIVEVQGKTSVAACILRVSDHLVGAYSGRYICVTYDDFVITKNVIQDMFKKLCRTNSHFGAIISPYSHDPLYLKARGRPTEIMFLDPSQNLVYYQTNTKRQFEIPASIPQDNLTIRGNLHDSGFYLITGLCFRMLEEKNRDNEPKFFFTDMVNKLQYIPIDFPIHELLRQAPPRFKIPDGVLKCMKAVRPEHFEKQYCKATALVVEDAVICRRLENIQSYMDAVKQIRTAARREEKSKEDKKTKESTDGKKEGDAEAVAKVATIIESDVCDGCTIANTADIRSSFIGPGCIISEDVRVHGCVVLSRVTIAANTRLSNCAVGEDSKVGKDCTLSSCSIARNSRVPSNSKLKNEMVGFSEIDFDQLVL
ncbi:hypothetical protein Aperf_G00000054623 [Anoplocephala perfoliata]